MGITDTLNSVSAQQPLHLIKPVINRVDLYKNLIKCKKKYTGRPFAVHRLSITLHPQVSF